MSYNCTISKKQEEEIYLQTINWLTSKTNRAVSQTKFLYNILGDMKMLFELEEAIKVFHVYYCPGNLAECFYLIGLLRTWKALGWIEKRNKYTLL